VYDPRDTIRPRWIWRTFWFKKCCCFRYCSCCCCC